MHAQQVTLTDQVAGKLADEIARGSYAIGAKLPSGKALAQRYGVSPAVIREATERLRAMGLVRSRQGSGCIVLARTQTGGFQVPVTRAIGTAQLASLYELRMELEGGAAALAALRRTPHDLAAMRRILDALERHAAHAEQGVEHDIAFHVAVASATHNAYYLQLLQYLNLQLRQAVQVARTHTSQTPGLAANVQEEHEAVYRAIEAGDTAAAREAAVLHLRGAACRLRLPVNLHLPEMP